MRRHRKLIAADELRGGAPRADQIQGLPSVRVAFCFRGQPCGRLDAEGERKARAHLLTMFGIVEFVDEVFENAIRPNRHEPHRVRAEECCTPVVARHQPIGEKEKNLRIRDVTHRFPLKLRQQEQPGVLPRTDDVEILDLERHAWHTLRIAQSESPCHAELIDIR